MKKLLFSLMVLLITNAATAQNVRVDKDGNFYALAKDTTGGEMTAKPTGKTYTDAKGNIFPVSVSARGKYFIVRISKAGNAYKQYLQP